MLSSQNFKLLNLEMTWYRYLIDMIGHCVNLRESLLFSPFSFFHSTSQPIFSVLDFFLAKSLLKTLKHIHKNDFFYCKSQRQIHCFYYSLSNEKESLVMSISKNMQYASHLYNWLYCLAVFIVKHCR